jgi:hypothetical protein
MSAPADAPRPAGRSRWQLRLAGGAGIGASPRRRSLPAPTLDLDDGWSLLVVLVVMAGAAFALGFFGLTAFVAAAS